MTDKIVILSTCATEEEAEKLARELVETRLAACVNLGPRIRSFYRLSLERHSGKFRGMPGADQDIPRPLRFCPYGSGKNAQLWSAGSHCAANYRRLRKLYE